MRRSLTLATRAGPIICDAAKVAFLSEYDALLVGDLHLEKASFLQMSGHAPLPALDTEDTLERLHAAILHYKPGHVISLGDSFHDIAAGARMSAKHISQLNNLVASLPRFTWVLGNHDPDIPPDIQGERENHLRLGRFLLTHLPFAPDTDEVNICGHLHPKLSVKLGRRRVSRPCFAAGQERVILPSFGTFTGGLFVTHPAIAGILSAPENYVVTDKMSVYLMDAQS